MTARGLRTPDVGRIYDALLGKDNYAEDRRAARRLIAAIPGIAAGARANREFPGRAVRFLAREAGIRQFLDIGAGLPAMGNSHAAAREAAADARVAYAGIDLVVICHVQGLPGKNPGYARSWVACGTRKASWTTRTCGHTSICGGRP